VLGFKKGGGFIKREKLKKKWIGFRVTDEEHERILDSAEKARMTVSMFVSLSSLGKDIIVIKDLKELIRQLSKAGNNLNQITKLAHQGRVACC